MNRELSRFFGKIWVLESIDAAETNGKRFNDKVLSFIKEIKKSEYSKRLSGSTYSPRLKELNLKLVQSIRKDLIDDLLEEIQEDTILSLFDAQNLFYDYLSCVADLFTKPIFIKNLKNQMKNKRHIHGLGEYIVKHTFCVSILGYLRGGVNAELLARTGMIHDLTIKNNSNYVAEFEHPITSSELARKLGESADIQATIRQHLFADIIRLGRIPKPKIARDFLIYDSFIAITERLFSMKIKFKELIK